MEFTMYLICTNVCLAAFYLLYVLFFKNSTFFVLNRIYLLATIVCSILIPFISVFNVTAPVQVNALSVYISTAKITDQVFAETAKYPLLWLAIIYWIGVAASSILFFARLLYIKKLLINPSTTGMAFTFWKTKVIDPDLLAYHTINEHESIHAKQIHTIDILLVEILGIFCWFNPIIYGYKRSVRNLHEFLADEHAAKLAGSKKNYAMMLFCQTFNASPNLTNSFASKTQLQMRVNMLQKNRSANTILFKYLLLLPVLFILFMLSSSMVNKPAMNGALTESAVFPGGFPAFSSYLIKSAIKTKGVKGRVVVGFTVDFDGTITNEKIIQPLNSARDNEALRIIRNSPKWKPALQNGQIVRSGYQIGINFN